MTYVPIICLIAVSFPTWGAIILGFSTYWFSHTSGTIQSLIRIRSDSGIVESALVDYRFSVSGKEYVGKRISIGRPRNLETMLSDLEPGGDVTVFYCKRFPSLCVLIRGVTYSSIVGCTVSLFFWVLLILYLNGQLSFLRNFVRPEQSPGS
jgi:hypothetical protein